MWLNLHRDHCQFFYIFLRMITTWIGSKRKFLKINTVHTQCSAKPPQKWWNKSWAINNGSLNNCVCNMVCTNRQGSVFSQLTFIIINHDYKDIIFLKTHYYICDIWSLNLCWMANKCFYEEPPIQVLNVYSQGSTYKWNLILDLDLWKIKFDLGFS